jgi:hypothetical protein
MELVSTPNSGTSGGGQSPTKQLKGVRDWRKAQSDIDLVKRVLQKSGVPLEVRMLDTVSRFCKAHAGGPLRASSLGPGLWRESENDAYREVDGMALLQEAISYGHVLIKILVYISLEAKYREDVEFFSFRTPHASRLPADSNASFSESVIKAYQESALPLQMSRLAAIKTGNGSGIPEKSLPYKEESLSHKAAGALANFVHHMSHSGPAAPAPRLDQGDAAAYLHRYETIRGPSGEWRNALAEFLPMIERPDHIEFLNKSKGLHELNLRIHVPIMVVSGRMNEVVVDPDGTIRDIKPASYAVTGERLPSWPPRNYFVSPGPQFPLIAASVEGLGDALEAMYVYALNVRNRFANDVFRDEFNTVSLESAVAAVIVDRFRKTS